MLVVLLLGVSVAGAYSWMTGASGPTNPVSVQVPRGATAQEVGSLLEEQGVIRSALAFRVLASFRDIGASLQAGRYELTTNMAIDDVFDALESGPAPKREITFTLPEGLELPEAADHVAEIGLDPERFRRLAESGDFAVPPYLPPGTETLEGFLYPETYSLPRRIDEKGLIERLLQQFRTVAGE
ncbi:MAG: endolytic transglycosylase MltG, partial [Gemmatimonadetes bacterium]|nr:endolytic transglycosylase MltG [Gemmatimonadota bacterium]